MKQCVVIALSLAFALFSVSVADAVRGQLGDAIDGDKHKHNFSANADMDGPRALDETGICVFCHTPHGASAESTLWNRRDPVGPNGNGTFPLYGSATSNLQDTDIQPVAKYGPAYDTYPNGASRLCLSCHDGVSAIGGVLNGGDIPMASGSETIQSYFGPTSPAIIDLTVSHPISFVYNGTVAGMLNEPGRKVSGDQYQTPDPAISPLDGKSRMQCTTCHDPHLDTRLGGQSGLPFWRHRTGNTNNDYDQVCQNCHLGSDWTNLATGKDPHVIPN